MRNPGMALGVGCALVLGLWANSAVAAKGRVGVRFSGSHEGAVKAAIVEVLEKHDLTVVDADKLEAAAGKMHRGLDTEGDLVAVAAKLKLTAIIAGEVKSGGNRAVAVVRNGGTGKLTARAGWAVAGGPRKLADAVRGSAWQKLGRGIGAGGGASSRRPAVAARRGAADDEDIDAIDDEVKAVTRQAAGDAEADREKPVAAKRGDKSDDDLEREAGISSSKSGGKKSRGKADDEGESSPASSRHRGRGKRSVGDEDEDVVVSRPGAGKATGERGLVALTLGVGPRLLSRTMRYGASPGPGLVPFSMTAAPTLGVDGTWYPGAHATASGFGANIGITGSVEYASSIVSKATDGAKFPTATSDYFGGLRLRLPIYAAALTATGGYGRHAFVFHSGVGTDRANVNVPDTDNRYLRAAGDLFLPLGSVVSLNLGAGYRNVLSSGKAVYQIQSAQYFPNATVSGYDLSASLGYRFLSVMEARLGYDLRKYTYTTHAAAGAPIQIASFADQYSAFWFNIGVSVDGAPRKSVKAAAAADEEDDEG